MTLPTRWPLLRGRAASAERGNLPLAFPPGEPAGAPSQSARAPRQRARDKRPVELPGAQLSEIVALIDQFSGLRYRGLPFPPHIEQRFEASTAARRAHRLWLEGLLVLVLYNLLLFADHLGTPALFLHAFLIRSGMITPLALMVNCAMLCQPNKHVREGSIACLACMAGLSNLYLESGSSPVISALAQFGILAVLLFSNTIMRLRFPYAVAATTVMLASDAWFVAADHQLLFGQKTLALGLTITSAAATLIANYSMGREERLNYLLCMQGDLMVEELRKANLTLRHIAERDPLTGLANRRLFNSRIAAEWERARRLAQPLGLVLIDVDRFKHINDNYGHPYGDRVLERIGHLLMESLRRKDDLAARFGGEEFVLLLPETPQELAMLVADRIRNVVETAGLPALDSGQAPQAGLSATVSCGVAACVPARGQSFQELIDAADKALYQAKQSGRNCIRAAA